MSIRTKWAVKPWYKFLNTNDGQIREVLQSRPISSIEECQRCYLPTQITSELDAKLTTYVCKSCRLDDQEWDYSKRLNGISITVQSMVMEQPESHFTDVQGGEGRN